MKLNRAARTHILEHLSNIRRATQVCLSKNARQREKQLGQARAEGAAARRMDLGESANPYSWTYSPDFRRSWLNGWITEHRSRS